MDWLVFVAGLVATFGVVGHFTIGTKTYLKPMLEAPIDDVPKRVMQSIFHYVSVYQILSALVLLAAGLGIGLQSGPETVLLVKFIAVNYLLFGVAQIAIALTTGIEGGIFKLFQWTLWVVIAVLAWLGVA